MAAVGAARHAVLAPYLKPDHRAIGSINSPMQCMMKEICAQCLQPQRDPVTGKVTYVFSCFNQDQPLDRVDFPGLDLRLKQNARAGEADGAVDSARVGGTLSGKRDRRMCPSDCSIGGIGSGYGGCRARSFHVVIAAGLRHVKPAGNACPETVVTRTSAD